MAKYYLDTCIWLDFFDERDEPHLAKGRLARKLIERIINNNDRITYSIIILKEMSSGGHDFYDCKRIFAPLKRILVFCQARDFQYRKAKDIANKRDVPIADAVHAIIARDNGAILVSRDRHFKKLKDIVIAKSPEEITGTFFPIL